MQNSFWNLATRIWALHRKGIVHEISAVLPGSRLLAKDVIETKKISLIAAGQATDFSLGTLRLGMTRDLQVEIVNELSRSLELESAKPSCGCTIAQIISF